MKANGRLAVVTGSAHRIGRVFALTLARKGYAMLLHYKTSKEKADSTAEEIRALGCPVTLVQADLEDPLQIKTLFSHIDGSTEPLQVFVNSAAVMKAGDIRELSIEEWNETISLNLRAPFLCSQAAAKRMKEGIIINVSDAGASRTWTGYPVYTVSKAALESLTRILARALAPQIRVNSIAPGLVFPSAEMDPMDWEKLVNRLPIRRTAAERELADALSFLIENEYITGQTIVLDGGYSLL